MGPKGIEQALLKLFREKGAVLCCRRDKLWNSSYLLWE